MIQFAVEVKQRSKYYEMGFKEGVSEKNSNFLSMRMAEMYILFTALIVVNLLC